MTDMDRVQKYLNKITELKAQKEEIEEAEKNYRAKIAEILPIGEQFVGDYKVNVRENRRFDAALAKKNLTPEELSTISVLKPDSTLAKKHLDEDRLVLTQKNHGTVVTVSLRND